MVSLGVKPELDNDIKDIVTSLKLIVLIAIILSDNLVTKGTNLKVRNSNTCDEFKFSRNYDLKFND